MELYEQTSSDEGQLTMAERRFLYDTVIERKPQIALEVGTWKGGGSTLALACGLRRVGGILHSCEPDKHLIGVANQLYSGLPQHIATVRLHNLRSSELINKLITDKTIPHLVFFDGPEEPNVAIDDLLTLEGHLKLGATFMMHDWEHQESIKCKMIKPYLRESPKWRIDKVLMPPISVGLVLATKVA